MLDNKKEGCWIWGKAIMQKGMENNCVELKKNKNGEYDAYERVYEDCVSTTKPFSSWIDDIDNHTGVALLKAVMGKNVFDYPKPVDLICRLL